MGKSRAIQLPWPYWTYYLINLIGLVSIIGVHILLYGFDLYAPFFSGFPIVMVLFLCSNIFYGLYRLQTGVIPRVFQVGWKTRGPPANLHRVILGFLFQGFGFGLVFLPNSAGFYWLDGIGFIILVIGSWLSYTGAGRTKDTKLTLTEGDFEIGYWREGHGYVPGILHINHRQLTFESNPMYPRTHESITLQTITTIQINGENTALRNIFHEWNAIPPIISGSTFQITTHGRTTTKLIIWDQIPSPATE